MQFSSMSIEQRKQILRLIEDNLDAMNLDNESALRLMKNGDEFQSRLVASIRELSVSNRFAAEEVRSRYTYPKEYKGPKPIEEQIRILLSLPLFSTLDPEPTLRYMRDEYPKLDLPTWVEGPFAIPRWEELASTYGEAVDRVLAAIASSRRFCNYREGQTGPEYPRPHAKTAAAFRKMGDEQQGHDILIVACQFGLRHRGRSVRRAREVMPAYEFGLGAFAVGCMILSHPEREVQWEQLHVACAGDEFAPDADGGFSYAPLFLFGGSGVWFNAYWFDGAHERYGSASGFLSPSCV